MHVMVNIGEDLELLHKMNGESNYESDASESWSVIDYNFNEESGEANFKENSEESPPSNVAHCDSVSGSVTFGDSTSDITAATNLYAVEDNIDNLMSNDEKNDSGDGDSIEIIDLEENYTDTQNLADISKNFDEESDIKIEDLDNDFCSNIVTRKRRKRQRSLSESSSNSLHSNSISSESKKLNKINYGFKLAVCNKRASAVDQQGQNFFKNTALSLCLGVFFASIACIAIGHFLGGPNASDTISEDLLETVKRLQSENAELQSRLSSFKTEVIPKEGSHMNKGHQAGHNLNVKPEVPTVSKAEINYEGKPRENTKFSSKEWLTKFQNLVREKQASSDLRKVVDYLQRHLKSINDRQNEDIKIGHLEESAMKIANVLQKIISSLTSSQENIEGLYQSLYKLKNKLNKQLSKLFTTDKRRPVTEFDLLTNPWNNYQPTMKERPIILYKFPQPEEYYMNEVSDENTKENDEPLCNEDTKESVNNGGNGTSKKQQGNSRQKRRGKETETQKKQPRDTVKGKERSSNILMIEKTVEKDRRNTKVNTDEYKESNRTIHANSKMKKVTKDNDNYKRKSKRSKHNRTDGPFVTQFTERPVKENYFPKAERGGKRNFYGKSQYLKSKRFSNRTGDWLFRWANGREQIRKGESMGEWQFDRARARRELRDDFSHLNW
ncbi:hypothetical protein RUM43_000155 [Polyplax serrata]|uniref:Uncharacterized protein n=1 Tax=Polyplax serrata TaxID=468196 RepID=A0AAN8SC23_POLSC